MKVKIYPAMDLLDGKVVRLYRGDRRKFKVYGEPLDTARMFSKYFDKIHIVDLDGAFSGQQRNIDLVRRIIDETGLRVQIGGGFRDYGSVERAYKIGVENVIIGTKALDEDFMKIVTRDFDGITVSIDSIIGRVGRFGWMECEDTSVFELFMKLRDIVKRFIYTITEKDGTLSGVDENDVRKFWNDEEFIYAGGVSKIDDLNLLKKIGFSGVIIGKAIYEGRLNMKELWVWEQNTI